ncbi:hypothetical protein FJT64_018363 [Amphibalanus amphitrite]|uniref:Uncharacterized protein n=1 Tax=Amphibalanus amphitrite TaxID=1232801 RepID=A0A6A4X6S2_AMPAM|nr:hypothetical protein FJT64_018363 [Amphibalanus amphitrite]
MNGDLVAFPSDCHMFVKCLPSIQRWYPCCCGRDHYTNETLVFRPAGQQSAAGCVRPREAPCSTEGQPSRCDLPDADTCNGDRVFTGRVPLAGRV